MDPIRILKFDIHGTEPLNTFVGEKILIKDKTCPWIIPDGSPYFAEPALVRVYDQRGGLLVRNRDYFLEEEFQPFCDATGRSIRCFIRLSDAILSANSFVKVDYQSLGAFFVPRSSLDEWLEKIKNGKPIPWSKVFNVPPTLPPEFHSHSVKTEIGDWYELTFFFKTLAGIYRTRDVTVFPESDRIITEAFDQLRTYKAQQLTKINGHDSNYNAPHSPTAANVNLGNLANYKTATPAEDLAGTRSDLYSTPLGVQQIAKANQPDDSLLMKTGIIPISKYAGDSFIPPNISGSFEGLGSNSLSSAMCMENSGLFMMLTAHHDGRNEGLYYSQVTDFYQPTPKITYTGFKYQPPSLLSRNFNPTVVISGSNHRIIMVGDADKAEWYVAPTNGTLDANSHQFVKCDMTAIAAKVPAAYRNMESRMSIHVIGDYAVLIYSVGSGNSDGQVFFRALMSALKGNTTVKWEHMPVTYKDYDGTQFTNADSYIPFRPIANPGGGFDRYGPMSFRQPASAANRNGRTVIVSTRKPTNSAVGYLLFVFGGTATYPTSAATLSIQYMLGMQHELNPATGVLTEIQRNPAWTGGFTDTTQTQRDSYITQHFYQFYNAYGQASTASVIVLETGEFAISTAGGGNTFPAYLTRVAYQGRKTAADAMANPLDIVRSPLSYNRTAAALVGSPLLSGTFPGGMTYEPDGENYMAVDQTNNSRKVFFRVVSGPYAQRPEVTNLEVGAVNSRPLTNTVYTTNLNYQETPIGITGSAAELTAGGVECGSTAFSSMGYSSMGALHTYPRIAEFKAPTADNMVLSCPRTFTKSTDLAARKVTYTPTSFWGIRQALIDKFQAMIPPEFTNYTPWSVNINILNAASGGMFKGLDLGVAVIGFHDTTKAWTRQMFVLFRPVIEAPNSDHPGSYWIKDITVLDTSGAYRAGINVRVAEQRLDGLSGNRLRGALHGYRDGNSLQLHAVNPYSCNTTSTVYTRQLGWMDIDLTTLKFNQVGSYYTGWSSPDIAVPIPKVGFCDFNLSGTTTENSVISAIAPGAYDYTGGAARLMRKTADDSSVSWHIGPTVYPETVWSLFFQDNVSFMINGVAYTISGGTVDLRDIDPAPNNKVFYIYATIEDGVPKYVFTLTKLRKRSSFILAAKVTTDVKQILTIERFQPFMIGEYTLSYTREGGTIPMSAGFPQDDGDFVFLRNAELLP